MTWESTLYYTIQFLRVSVAFIGVKLFRCAFISLPVLGLILLLRLTLLRRFDFFRCAVWSLLLFLPFLGKLRWFYETRLGIRLFWWMIEFSMDYCVLDGIYLCGVAVALLLMVRRHRALRVLVGDMEPVEKGVYLSDMAISPFTFGLIQPGIVIPKVIYQSFSEDELNVVLQHERTHIALGHLWMLRVWELLQCIFWVNPLFAFSLKYFKEDIEWICDRICIQNYRQDARSYGQVLLKSAAMLSAKVCPGSRYAAFNGESGYRELKKRVQHIAECRPYNKRSAVVFICVLAVFIAAVFTGIHSISYPRYTNFDEIVVFDSTGTEQLLEDSDELRQAISIDEETVYVDREMMNSLFDAQGLQPDLFFIYFGGYYKLPGIGGGGNGVFCCPEDFQGDMEIPYQGKEDIWTLLFRYL